MVLARRKGSGASGLGTSPHLPDEFRVCSGGLALNLPHFEAIEGHFGRQQDAV